MMYGSLTNQLMERARMPKPEIGMGVTEILWSDSHAWEIIAIKDDRHITVRRLKCTMTEGTDWLDQEYNYESDESAQTVNLFKTKKGDWRERHGRNSLGDTKFCIGFAREYRDPSF